MISILVPFRNAAPWVEEMIRSVQIQTYTNWELIAVNDHSTDNSAELIRAVKDERIQVVNNQTKGIIPALQMALNLAMGNYITRMDSDDLMPENRLELFHRALLRAPVNTIVSGKVRYFSENPVSEGYMNYENWLNERIDEEDHFQQLYRECVIASPNWMVRKQPIIDSKIFDLLAYPEDYHMTFLWKYYGFEIKCVPEVTLLWREHPIRTSRNSAIYQQESFFRLKIQEFVRNECKNHETVGILGAGTKGKLCATLLAEHGKSFQMFDLNHHKYKGAPQLVFPIDRMEVNLLLIAIYPKQRKELEQFLSLKNYVIGKNAWYV